MPAVLLDTCAIICLAEHARMSLASRQAIAAAMKTGDALLSAVSAWEIGLLARPGKRLATQFLPDAEAWWSAFAAQPGLREIALTPAQAVASSFLPASLHGDPADRLLAAQARDLDVPLVTRDRPLLDFAKKGHMKVVRC